MKLTNALTTLIIIEVLGFLIIPLGNLTNYPLYANFPGLFILFVLISVALLIVSIFHLAKTRKSWWIPTIGIILSLLAIGLFLAILWAIRNFT